MSINIVIVAGELSGDILGAGLIRALRTHFPAARFSGIGGERMLAEGFDSLFSLERLSVMGLVEVVRQLPDIYSIHRRLYRRFSTDPPDIFIGIDAPEFNLSLERKLRRRGITTVQYVSPKVWAWRQGRVHKIARCVDLILTLFPFEADFYRNHNVPVHYVGHPLADEIPLKTNRNAAREALGLALDKPLLALLPGSRMSEVKSLGPLFIATALWLRARRPELGFVLPVATPRIREFLSALLAQCSPEQPIQLLDGRSREAMAAADGVLLASGTATLEALLLKRPMVVSYKVSALTAFIGRLMLKVRYVSQPNLLAGRELVPEILQDAATVENLGPAVLDLLDDASSGSRLEDEFNAIHRTLRRNASVEAAAAIAELLQKKRR